MGGYQVESHGSGDDGYNEQGYDESQRAEILEVTRTGPNDGDVATDLNPDLEEDDRDMLDDLEMTSDQQTGEDEDRDLDAADRDEDEVQAEFDDGTSDEDDLDDSDDEALRP